MFGKTLKKLRENYGYSMDKLIELYNKKYSGKMNKSTLSRYENGLQEPMYTVVVNLAKLFNVSVDYLSGATQSIETTSFFTSHEKKVINAYRSKPEMQPAVDKILEIDSNDKPYSTLPPFIAADTGEQITAEAPDIDTIIEIENLK